MKKTFTFIFSFLIAVGITIYSKNRQIVPMEISSKNTWRTFSKNHLNEVYGHQTTTAEYLAANIPDPVQKMGNNQRSPSSVAPSPYLSRHNRKLMGTINGKYADTDTELEMINVVSREWKEQMGTDLMRFQSEKTKIMVREDASLIKIENEKGRYVEQVTITFLMDGGITNSFKALVDSGSGRILETWDKSIHERISQHREVIPLPDTNESGIVTR